MKYLLLLLIATTLLTTSCTKNYPCPDCSNGELVQLIDLTGLDGCTWVFERFNGTRLEPVNLSSFSQPLVDSAFYKIEFQERTDLASNCMVGKIVELTCLEQEPVNTRTPDETGEYIVD